jgi:hypothetical protein
MSSLVDDALAQLRARLAAPGGGAGAAASGGSGGAPAAGGIPRKRPATDPPEGAPAAPEVRPSSSAAEAAIAALMAAKGAAMAAPVSATPAGPSIFRAAVDTAPIWQVPAGGLATLAGTASIAGFPSGVTSISNGPAGMSMNLHTSPAAAAALLGPGGLPAMLAAFRPTRVLAVLNVFSESDLASRAGVADVLRDCAAEAQRATAAAAAAAPSPPFPFGGLLRAVAPLPRKGETLEPRLARPRAAMTHVGADGLLEDAPARPEFEVGGARRAGGRSANEGALIVAPDVAALSGLGQRQRNALPSLASEFFKKTGGFSEGMEVLEHASAVNWGGKPGGAWKPPPSSSSASAAAAAAHASAPSPAPRDATSEDVPGAQGSAAADEPVKRTRGLGRVYLEFGCVNSAAAAMMQLAGRFFAGRILVVTYVDEEKFLSGQEVALSETPVGVGSAREMGSIILAGKTLEAVAAEEVVKPVLDDAKASESDAPPDLD